KVACGAFCALPPLGRHPAGRPAVDQTRSCAFVGHQLRFRWQKASFLPAAQQGEMQAVRCRVIAAGTRLPEWVNQGFREYQKRLRSPLVLDLVEIPVAARRAGEDPQRSIAREGECMLATLAREDYVVALELFNKWMTTDQLSVWPY